MTVTPRNQTDGTDDRGRTDGQTYNIKDVNIMSKQSIEDLSADHRRAASIIIHYGKRDDDGINAILTESAEVDRVVPLIFAILSVYDQIIPELRSETGQAVLSSLVHDMAGQEQ